KKEEVNVYDVLQGIILSQANVEGMDYCFDVIRNNVNKGTGVKRVLDYLGLPTEKSIAFGDGLNDMEMLCNVGEGFAMGNSHPDLFQYAKHRTTDVMDSGLYNGLKSLGLID
ncbi:MAG: HAD family hydrolase, partial [Heyndrickxia sp.]